MGVATHTVQVVVETEGFTCEGLVHVKTGGYRTRVSDLLNEEPPFLAMTDVTLRRSEPNDNRPELEHHETIVLRKSLIKYVIPLD
jgi:hypothetical protein